MSTVRFLTRRVCRICSEALPIVEHRALRRGHTLEVLDVDDSGLADEFGDRVPVVLVDDVEVLSGRFTVRDVKRAVQ